MGLEERNGRPRGSEGGKKAVKEFREGAGWGCQLEVEIEPESGGRPIVKSDLMYGVGIWEIGGPGSTRNVPGLCRVTVVVVGWGNRWVLNFCAWKVACRIQGERPAGGGPGKGSTSKPGGEGRDCQIVNVHVCVWVGPSYLNVRIARKEGRNC